MNNQVSANDTQYALRLARSLPVLSSLTGVRGYPDKLRIFRIRGSCFWQARCFMNGKMYVRSMRTIEKRKALEAAKQFYEELIVRLNNTGKSEHDRIDAGRINQTRIKHTFTAIANRAVDAEKGRMLRGELSLQSFKALRNRFKKQILPYFADKDIGVVKHDEISAFTAMLVARGASSITVMQYLQSIRMVFKYALVNDLVNKIPPFPKIKLSSQPRGGFSVSEYRQLLRAAKKLAHAPAEIKLATHRDRAGGIFTKTESVPKEMAWMIGFMVNGFMRPTDLKYAQHKHVEIIRGEHVYLRLSLPETKRHKAQIVTLRPAVRIYQNLRKYSEAQGWGKEEDYLFLPHVADRDAASVVLSMHFNKILEATHLKIGELGQVRSLYSLRHTAIMFRLLYGKGIDLLTLARNARTSVQMIEQFYASNLTAEMNIGLLQSKR